jgi:hypothetical protein
MLLLFIYTHDNIQKAVKQETSLLAERRYGETDAGGRAPLLDELVMDEEYDVLFKRYFNSAHASLLSAIPARYVAETPTDLESVFTEFPDFTQDRDFCLFVRLPDDFPEQYRKSIDYKLEQYMIDYVCYRWLETKSPEDGVSYYSRLNDTLNDVTTMMSRRLRGIRRLGSFP